MICEKKHRYAKKYESLPDAQDDRKGGRHICAGCAFKAGKRDGKTRRHPRESLESLNLPESQAGTVRHKDAYAAYLRGFAKSRKKRLEL